MNTSSANRRLLTTQEAIALVKRAERAKGTRFFVYVRADAPLADKPGRVFPEGCFASLELSKAEALDLLSRFLTSELEVRGGRIPITTYDYPGEDALMAGIPSIYWIG